MMQSRKAFTLIELMISVTIISIMIIFLYESYAQLNHSNKIYRQESDKIKNHQTKKKIIFLDFSLKTDKEMKILNQDKHKDIVFFQSTNSIHKRYYPYIAYIAKADKLYRLESLKEFKEYPLTNESIFDVDYLGEINDFRVYKANPKKIVKPKELDSIDNDDNATGNDGNSTKAKSATIGSYLVHVDFKKEDDILYKIAPLN